MKEGSQQIAVLIADDHPVVREGLVALINRQEDMQIVAEACNWLEAVEKFCSRQPDVGMMDLRMPGMDAVDAISAIREHAPEARIILLTTYDNEEDIYQGLQAGAKGYLLKDTTREELVQCIRAVNNGGTWIPPAVAAKLASRVGAVDLTDRELEVLRLMVTGKSNKEIGAALNVTEGTVKVHVSHILQKLRASGRTEAISLALKRGVARLD
ncbi:MAG: DNA-binding response regulator [Acidobacteria bacterium]|nr:MAG: DNA-binding response regulator [Acidobacteriota bacterium]